MAKMTEIQWCDSTVNSTTGCDGCELWARVVGGPCYAGNYHQGRMAKALPDLYAADFTEVRLAPGRMAKAAGWSDLTGTDRPGKPWLNGLPRIIFVGDMGDLFSKAVPFEYIRDEVLAAAASAKGRRHIWMWLTKQPKRLVQFYRWLSDLGYAWPGNIWTGTSITSKATVGRIRDLLPMPGIRFISAEPLVEEIGCPDALFAYQDIGSTPHYKRLGPIEGCEPIDLVIVGGESDQAPHKARPFDVQWARTLIKVTRDTPIKVFVKQLGSRPCDSARRISIDSPGSHAVELDLRDHHGGNMAEWPAELRVREFPWPLGVAAR